MSFEVIVKSGLTMISIVIISISLYPVHDLLSSLKPLRQRAKNSSGFFADVPKFPYLQSMSFPTLRAELSALSIIRNYCSPFFVTAFVAAGIAWVASALAPTALSIQTILADGDIQAFSVGAIPPLSFYSLVASGQTIPPMQLAISPGYPASIAWVEIALGMSYAHIMSNKSLGEYAAFVAPMPTSIQASTTARWLTDVVGLNPFCTWVNPVNLTKSSSSKAMNSTSVAAKAVTAYLEGLDLDIVVPSSIIHKSISTSRPTSQLNQHQRYCRLMARQLSLSVCTEGCTGDQINIISIYPDLTDIPTLKFTAPNNTCVTVILQPIPLENLTEGYTQIVQAVAKVYITGSEGTAYVEGRVSGMQLIFTSSMPNVIVAALAFALLWALVIYAHFRKGKYHDFTLVNVGAALYNLEIPE
ncbi:hypothetical protein EV702DRAFT_1048431 [Suillus placidus]|uniref:Uncharacterized protein n=1 Tax=Suillus placidus TaxID=48579 RepID=A0A9P7D038_9AGAM|nr:hypothetical protein EV702DRAFT_1048431 [Suillus placidus]